MYRKQIYSHHCFLTIQKISNLNKWKQSKEQNNRHKNTGEEWKQRIFGRNKKLVPSSCLLRWLLFFLWRQILQNSSKIGRMKSFYQSTFVGFKRITTVRQESIEHFLRQGCFPNNNQFQYRNIGPQGLSLRYLSICLQRQSCVWLDLCISWSSDIYTFRLKNSLQIVTNQRKLFLNWVVRTWGIPWPWSGVPPSQTGPRTGLGAGPVTDLRPPPRKDPSSETREVIWDERP